MAHNIFLQLFRILPSKFHHIRLFVAVCLGIKTWTGDKLAEIHEELEERGLQYRKNLQLYSLALGAGVDPAF